MDASNLLRAVAAAPDDDAPRLVYADWLEQQGDPRGEFIAVQCALAALAGLSGAPLDRRAALEARERALIGANRRRWLAELDLTASEGAFRRGFVEDVTLWYSRLLEVHEALVPVPAPIRGLHLHARPEDAADRIPRLLALPLVDGLTRLSFTGVRLNNTAMTALAGAAELRGLRSLGLKGHVSTPEALRILCSSTHLGGLTSLDLSFGGLGVDEAKQLASSPHGLGNLTHLNLAGVQLKTEGALALLSATRLPLLRHLDLSANAIEGPAALVSFGALVPLESLNLAGNDIRAAELQGVAPGSEPATLRELNLSYNDLGDGGARALAALPQLARLTKLQLFGCTIGDAGVAALVSSTTLSGLTALSLGQNRVGLEGAKALAASPHLDGMRELNLRGCSIDDEPAGLLRERFGDSVLL